jgi:transcriptional regulator with XRE-family HTH domain
LRLRARGEPVSGEVTDVLVRNLSATGLLIETAAELQVGDELEVDLPETPRALAKVVWAGDGLFGCAFDSPLPHSAISAAQLRSEPEGAFAESQVESNPDIHDLAEEHWGQRLKRLRQAKGFSVVDFARRMKVSRPTVWSWEAGKSLPRASKHQLLLDVLGVTNDELQGHAGPSAIERRSEPAASRGGELKTIIDEAKKRVAEAAGTSADNVRMIIEV